MKTSSMWMFSVSFVAVSGFFPPLLLLSHGLPPPKLPGHPSLSLTNFGILMRSLCWALSRFNVRKANKCIIKITLAQVFFSANLCLMGQSEGRDLK